MLDGPMEQFNRENVGRKTTDGVYVSVMIVCVDYTFDRSSRHHQTAVNFSLVKKGNPQLFSAIFLREAPIPPELLSLTPFLFGGHYAN